MKSLTAVRRCPVATNRFVRFSWFSVLVFNTSFLLTVTAEDEMNVGHNAAGQLKVEVSFTLPLPLPVSVFPGLPGYATGDVGLHSAPVDEPANDFYQLSSAADLRFILVAKDPGMEVLNDHGSAYMQVGETFFVGPAAFDTHPVWDLVNGTPGHSYSLTLKIKDLNGVYADSDPLVLSFTPNPPVLEIRPAAPGFVLLSWSPDTPGFVLQSAPALQPTAWTNAPSSASNPVTVAISPGARYYRVKR